MCFYKTYKRSLAVILTAFISFALFSPVSVMARQQPPTFRENFAGAGFTVDFIVNSNWYNNGNSGYNAQLILTNTGNEPIVNWLLKSSEYLGIHANFQNGARLVSQDKNHSTLQYLNWNYRINPGAYASIWLYSHSTTAPSNISWSLESQTKDGEDKTTPPQDDPPRDSDDKDKGEKDKGDKDKGDKDKENGETVYYTLPVSVQFRNPNIGNILSQLDPWFKITANSDINLADLTIRYFYTINGRVPQNFVIDWSSIDTSLITGSFEYMGQGFYNADYFFELGFTGGQLLDGQSIYINARIFKDDHSHFIQYDNFSFAGEDALSTHIYWDGIAVFYNGVLIWGTEPCEKEEDDSFDYVLL